MKGKLLLILFMGLFLAACQTSPQDRSGHSAACREIKSRMILFNGSSPNENQTFQEKMDQPLLQKSFHNENCV